LFQWKYGGVGLSAEPVTLHCVSHGEEACEVAGWKAFFKGLFGGTRQDMLLHWKLKGPHAFRWKDFM
jgi:hypothetical protein